MHTNKRRTKSSGNSTGKMKTQNQGENTGGKFYEGKVFPGLSVSCAGEPIMRVTERKNRMAQMHRKPWTVTQLSVSLVEREGTVSHIKGHFCCWHQQWCICVHIILHIKSNDNRGNPPKGCTWDNLARSNPDVYKDARAWMGSTTSLLLAITFLERTNTFACVLIDWNYQQVCFC